MARKMKDSGIEWIGEIPTDFSLYKLKYLLSSPLCYGANESGTLYSDILPRYIRITDISPNGTLKNSGMLSLDESSAQNYMLHEGDILFARSGATVGKSFIYHNYYGRAAYAGYLIKASFNRLVLPEFVYYYTCSSAYEIWKNSIFIQSTIQNIGADRYSNLPISVPNSIDKQLRIVRYLNNFCSKFDAIIYNLQTSIEDYKKLKQAVITQAVTKGVRGKREMKDSGVDYIGQIPAKWVLGKLRNVGDTQNGISKSSEFFGKGFPFVSYSDVYKNYSLPFAVSGLVESTPEEQERYSVKEGDIFFTRTSETIEEVGFSCVCEKDIPNATFAGFLIRVRPFSDRLYTPYAKYYFRSTHLRFYLVKEMNLVTRASLGQSLLKSMPVLLPPLEEQKEIANYLDAKCAEIDRLIAKKEQLVKELESYKKGLIYEVVTGKREV